MSITEKLVNVLLVLLICLVATETARRATAPMKTKCDAQPGFVAVKSTLSFATDTFTCYYEKSK